VAGKRKHLRVSEESMILIIGGAWQGKLTFATELARSALDSSISNNEIEEEHEIAEGSRDSFEAAMTCPIIHGLHEYIRRLLKEGKSVDAFLEAVWRQNPDVIITSDELGCGIVPFDPADREWREVSGRASVRLARISREVYRMVCGIATQIK
jgi:adenosylcobinamide kinase/adenosylcobinamide-phosphate guanylyltransferase